MRGLKSSLRTLPEPPARELGWPCRPAETNGPSWVAIRPRPWQRARPCTMGSRPTASMQSTDEAGRCSRARDTESCESRRRRLSYARRSRSMDGWRSRCVARDRAVLNHWLATASSRARGGPSSDRVSFQANATRVSGDAWRDGPCALDAWSQERGSFVVYLWSVCHSVDRVPRRYGH